MSEVVALHPEGGPTPPLDTFEGHRLEWRPWKLLPTMFACGPDGFGAAGAECDGCGTDVLPWTTFAISRPMPGETVMSTLRTTRSGRTYETKPHPVPAGRHARLHAFRCRECGLTQIFDEGRDHKGWDEVELNP